MTTETVSPSSIPVRVARAAVLESGELVGIDGPHFLAEPGADWLPYHLGDDAPLLARVIVTRKGHNPREVVISWQEYADQREGNPDWDATRESKPMMVFGAEAERHAYSVVFADILAPLRDTTKTEHRNVTNGDPWEPAPEPRDFLAELATTRTPAEVDELHAAAKRASKVTTAMWQAFRDRRAELAKPAAAPVPHPPATKLTPATERPKPRKPRRSPGMTAALSSAVADAESHGRPVPRAVRRVTREQGQP
jgi:hypothetical protein